MLALALLLCAALMGCALSKDDLLPRSTPPVVKIGLVAPFERRYRTLGYEVLYAVKWVLSQRNAQGGVSGAMIELVALNDNADPESSAFQARKFAVDPDVVAIIGPFTGDTVLAAAPLYEQLGLAAVTPAMCSLSVAGRIDGVFCLGLDVDRLAEALLGRLPGEARATLLRSGDGPLGDRLSRAVQRAVDVPLDESELGAIVGQSADVYLYDGDVLDAAQALLDMRRAGIEAPFWGGPSLARTQLPQIADQALGGTCYVVASPLFADLSPDSAFASGYEELAGGPPGPWAGLAYDATQLLLGAIERDIAAHGRATRQGVMEQIAQAEGPSGQPVFVEEQRRQATVSFYCYRSGDGYPGRHLGPQ
jgi:branched-chain amino acid transport system substrate-binding protein